MKRIGIFVLSSLAVMGCQKDNDVPLEKKLGAIDNTLKEILVAIKAQPTGRAGAARPARPQRPKPNPKAVYSVDVNGAPFKGAKDAKVTIVEAFEFA